MMNCCNVWRYLTATIVCLIMFRTISILVWLHQEFSFRSDTIVLTIDEFTISEPIKEPLLQPYTYASPIVRKEGCIITVVLMEPVINQGSLAALESVATHVHPLDRTCVLIQTSSCNFDHQQQNSSYQLLTDSIIEAARPNFRKLIQAGNVRVSIMNQTRYNHPACNHFDANHAWFNYYYWDNYSDHRGEFIAGIDSDFVLLIQADSILCHGLHVPSWHHLSFVGAPWAPHAVSWWNPCIDIPGNWKNWHDSNPIPPSPESDSFCSNPHKGPIGNGGLSLRSRYWLQQAIKYCPSSLSGLSISSSCYANVNRGPSEDVYFSTILLGLDHNPSLLTNYNETNATTPTTTDNFKSLQLATMFEAALFSSEMLVLSHLLVHYAESSPADMTDLVQNYWWDAKYNPREIQMLNISDGDVHTVEDGIQMYERMRKLELESSGTKPIIPIGLHKIWQFFKMDDHIFHECPLYRDQLTPQEMGKFHRKLEKK